MEKAGFILAMVAGLFSVFLLGWKVGEGASADWVYGFLAVFWSMIMMLRLMTLTEPAHKGGRLETLAQKIIGTMRERQEEYRQEALENAFGGSYFLFICAGLFFAAWQIYCAAFPAQAPVIDTIVSDVDVFFDGGQNPLWEQAMLFEWGQGFMLLLSFFLMGFVLRSYAGMNGMTRPMLLILCGYAVAGFITLAGLKATGGDMVVAADFAGNGRGAMAFLFGSMPDGKIASLFDILILENGIIGFAVLTFILFIPLGFISLSAQNMRSDKMVVLCGMITGSVMILSVFLPFTPFLGGLMAMGWMALFLAWGHAENALKARA